MNILSYSLDNLEKKIVELGGKAFNARQIYEWIYKKHIFDFDLFSNISKDLREILKTYFTLSLPAIDKKQTSKDGTVKYLFVLDDGSKVECVLMNHEYGKSVCISTEVGCSMGCAFCASGLLKKERNIESGEMVSFILAIEKDLDIKVTHVVLMGTGEPLDNYDNVVSFIKIINCPNGLEIGIRHITLSTCGIVPKIYDLANEGLGINLAISLHFPTQELREKYMKIAKAYPLDSLLDACKEYFLKTGRRITFEYLLLKGVNSSDECAIKLSEICKNINSYINLIPYNKVSELSFSSCNEEEISKFYNKLKSLSVNVQRRYRLGEDIDAACGQLRLRSKE